MSKISKNVNNLSEDEAKDMLISHLENDYTLVQWPDSQALMDKWWFKKEAILDVDGKFGSSAYLVPTKRLLQQRIKYFIMKKTLRKILGWLLIAQVIPLTTWLLSYTSIPHKDHLFDYILGYYADATILIIFLVLGGGICLIKGKN